MNKIRLAAIVTFLFVLLMLVPIFFVVPLPVPAKIGLAVALSNSLLNIGATVLLVWGLKGFKHHLRVAYWYIVASALVLVVGAMQFPVLGALDAYDSPWVRYGGVDVPFILTGILAYTGVYKLSRLMNIKTKLFSPSGMLALAAVACTVAFFVPTFRTDIPEIGLKFNMAIYTLQAVLLISSTYLAYRIKSSASTLYVSALSLLFASYLAESLATISRVATHPFFTFEHWFNQYRMGSWLYVLGAALLVLSAVAFNKLRFIDRGATQSNDSPLGSPSKQSSIDIIVTTAQFASDAKSIDVILDKLRSITANSGPQPKLTPEQQTDLAATYLKLETFLVEQEPLRKFDAQSLREMLDLRFRGSVDEPSFWQRLDATPPAPVSSKT